MHADFVNLRLRF